VRRYPQSRANFLVALNGACCVGEREGGKKAGPRRGGPGKILFFGVGCKKKGSHKTLKDRTQEVVREQLRRGEKHVKGSHIAGVLKPLGF